MRFRNFVVWGVFTAGVVGSASMALCADADRPNIVVILADDLGYADLGFQGGRDIPTPNLDALAASGTRFTNAYVSGPYCSPTRAGLLTGRYQQRFGHEFNPGGGRDADVGLPVSETTLADRLRAAGYVTGLVGKWHLGSAPQFVPTKRGFDEFFGFLDGAHTYFPGGAPIYRGDQPIKESAYLTDAFGREAVSFIDRHAGKPFFLYLAFNAVHTPMEATRDRLTKFDSIADQRRRTNAAMTFAMDEAIGQVLNKLRDAGLEENTLVFFFSDNGGPTMPGTTTNGSSNAPLRGSKRTTLEGGIRVPFVIRWPGHVPAGEVRDEKIIQLDIAPTALAAAGKPDESAKFDGVNLLPLLLGESDENPHETLYWRFGDQMALRHGDWKLVRYDLAADTAGARGVTEVRLYNLAEDIGEGHDLAADNPAKVKELTELWDAWDSQLVEPLWGAPRRGSRARAGAGAG